MAATGDTGSGRDPRSPRSGGGVPSDPNDWRVQILTKIGAPVTATNLTALQAWALSESGYNSTYGTNLAGPLAFNPLAITDSYGVPTVGSVNSVGVKKFANTQAGVDATALFWQHGYQGIIDALRNSDPVALYQAVNQSGWCAGCQGGHYPIGLSNFLSGGAVQGGGAKFQGGGSGTPGGSSGSGSGGSSGGSGDSGGLFGTCKITTTSIPFVSGGIPSGGFGCYIEKTLIFSGLAIGGTLLMAIGLGLVVLGGKGTAQAVGLGSLGELGEVGALASIASKLGKGSSLAPAVPKDEPKPASLADMREKRQQELHRARKSQANAKAREARAKAREAELRAPTSAQRVRAAGRGETRAAGPVGSGPARLQYETPGF